MWTNAKQANIIARLWQNVSTQLAASHASVNLVLSATARHVKVRILCKLMSNVYYCVDF